MMRFTAARRWAGRLHALREREGESVRQDSGKLWRLRIGSRQPEAGDRRDKRQDHRKPGHSNVDVHVRLHVTAPVRRAGATRPATFAGDSKYLEGRRRCLSSAGANSRTTFVLLPGDGVHGRLIR